MKNGGFFAQMQEIEGSIREAGYDPYLQLSGFILTQDERYITRRNDTRRRVVELDRHLLDEYVRRMKPGNRHP